MNKEEILKIIGLEDSSEVAESSSALEISITGEGVDIFVTLPHEVTDVYFEARNKEGILLVKDWHDHYGDTELDDYRSTLEKVSSAIKNPNFRVTNNGKTVQLKEDVYLYFFGEFNF